MAEHKKGKHAGHGFHSTHIEHHKDGSHTVHHKHSEGPQHDVKHAVADLDGAHDSMESNLGQPNEGEGQVASAMPAPAAAPAAGGAPMSGPVPGMGA